MQKFVKFAVENSLQLFHIFRNKPYLKDLLPEHHLDFHSHLLPGIDDGAKNIDDTLKLVSAMQNLGIESIITTPHIMKNVWDNTPQMVSQQLTLSNDALKSNNNTIQLRAAAEYLLDGNFAELIKNEPLLTLKDQYVLVEMSYLNPPIQLYEILFDLQVAGYKPVLAHPERYLFYHNNTAEYEKLKHAGCLFQLNLLAVVGYYGFAVAETATKLLKKGFFDFAGSDIHHHHHVGGFLKRIVLKDALPIKEALEGNGLFKL